MAIEAVAALAAKELGVQAAREAAIQAAREIAQKMAAEAGMQGSGREVQTAMMERQAMQEGFRIGEMPETKGEGRELCRQKEAEAAEELRGKIDAGENHSVAETEPETNPGKGQEATEERVDAWEDHATKEYSDKKTVYDRLECGRDAELLNGELPENSVLEVDNPAGKNHIRVETNGQGRVVELKADHLERIDGGRDIYQQRRCCQIKEGKPDDDGGHLCASEFGGPKEQFNYSPMNKEVNRHGEYRLMEKNIEKALDAGQSVTEYRIRPQYEGDSLRPEKFTVSMKIDGVPKHFQIKNPAMVA